MFFVLQYMRNGGGSECPLPFATDASHGAMGKKSFYTHTTKTSIYETTAV